MLSLPGKKKWKNFQKQNNNLDVNLSKILTDQNKEMISFAIFCKR